MQEIWKDLSSYENLYQISNYGRLKRFIKGNWRVLKGCIFKGNSDYIYFDISKDGVRKRIRAHVIVAQHFIPNPENKPEVNHLDGNKHNPREDNLEWSTVSENNFHAIRTGLRHHRGQNNGSSTMTDIEAKVLIQRLKDGETLKILSKETGLNKGHLSAIRKGTYWKHLQ